MRTLMTTCDSCGRDCYPAAFEGNGKPLCQGCAPCRECAGLRARVEAAEAKLAEAERERDVARYDRAHGAAADVANLQARVEALEKALRRYRDAVSYDHETDTITIVSSVEAMLAQHEADAALSAGKPG